MVGLRKGVCGGAYKEACLSGMRNTTHIFLGRLFFRRCSDCTEIHLPSTVSLAIPVLSSEINVVLGGTSFISCVFCGELGEAFVYSEEDGSLTRVTLYVCQTCLFVQAGVVAS